MISSKYSAKECEEIATSLEKTANGLSLIYTVSIWLAIVIGIVLIGDWIDNRLINFIVGGTGLLLTLVPLVLKNKIEKIEGYVLLSIKFKNLQRDFLNHPKNIGAHNQFKELREELCKYPIVKFVKWLP
jgi:hypothetical protein